MIILEEVNKTIDVQTYVKEYVEVEKFIKLCQECPNYSNVWGCPPHNNEAKSTWLKYDRLELVAFKYALTKEEKEEGDKVKNKISYVGRLLSEEKKMFRQILMEREGQYENSLCLQAGSCELCMDESFNRNCLRGEGEDFSKCRHPKEVRSSLESLGADVTKTTEKLLGIPILWIQGDVIPEYFVLCGGVLVKE